MVEWLIGMFQCDCVVILLGFIGYLVVDCKVIEVCKVFLVWFGMDDVKFFSVEMFVVELQVEVDCWVND